MTGTFGTQVTQPINGMLSCNVACGCKLAPGKRPSAFNFFNLPASLQEMEKMLEKYKSKEVKKQFAEVKKELMKLTPPENLVVPPGVSPDALATIRDGDAYNALDLSAKPQTSTLRL